MAAGEWIVPDPPEAKRVYYYPSGLKIVIYSPQRIMVMPSGTKYIDCLNSQWTVCSGWIALEVETPGRTYE